ncbi:MAG: hypothetical protein ACOY9D_08250 [Pseudomonadota bacterium]
MPHLVVSISGHGFGHVAQTAPILNRLHQCMPQLRLTVRSAVPLSHLRSRIHAPFTHLCSEGDIGMVMSSALDVLVGDSCLAYRAFHADWDARVAGEARLLSELKADLVFSNVGYLPLAGAQRAGIRSAALCSLNWLDIYRHYCGDDAIAAQIQECYAGADAFLRATPGMAMAHLPNLVEVAPIADAGNDRRDELNRKLRLSKEEKLVLVSMGGIRSRLPMEKWPRIEGVHWLVQADWQIGHPDAIVLESLPLGFGDLLASSDALLCKPGYGSFTEAACSATPVLYVARSDWPESPALVEWLQRYGICREVSRQALEQGDIATELASLWLVPESRNPLQQPEKVMPGGAAQVAAWLVGKLDG